MREASSARGHKAARLFRRIEPLLVALALIGLWELLTRTDVLPHQDFPPATTIFGDFVADLGDSGLWSSIGYSMAAWCVGLGIAIAVALPLGMLLGSSRIAYRGSTLTLEFLRTVPSIAALPVLLFVYGITFQLTVALVVLASVWPLLIQTMYGVYDVDPVLRDTGRIYGLSRWRSFTRVVLPSAAPYIATGLRLSAIMGLILAIATSLIVGGEGLGAEIAEAQRNGQTSLIYARVLLTSLIGLAVTFMLFQLERRVLRWHPSHRPAAS